MSIISAAKHLAFRSLGSSDGNQLQAR